MEPPHLVDRDFVCVGILDGLNYSRLVIGKVFELHNPTFALDEVNNRLSYPTFVKSISSLRNNFSEGFS